MLFDKTQTKEILQNFVDICNENKIWYSLDNMFLLGAIRHSGFIPWHEKLEVMVTVESFNKLKRLFGKNIIDSSIDRSFDSLTAAWVEDNKQWKKDQPFIQIRVAIATTTEKLKEFQSTKQKLTRIWKRQEDNIKRAIDELYTPNKFQGYYVLTNRKGSVQRNWIQVLTFKMETINILDVAVNIPKEYKAILESWFGKGYMDAKMPEMWFDYPAPLKKVEAR